MKGTKNGGSEEGTTSDRGVFTAVNGDDDGRTVVEVDGSGV